MDPRITEILSRNGIPVNQEEAIEVVEYYIFQKKKVKVKINLMKNIRPDLPEQAKIIFLGQHLQLLFRAFLIASHELTKQKH